MRKRRGIEFNLQEYERLTRHSSLGTLHAIDFSGNEQPLCELTALDTDILIGRLCDLEDLIEDGTLISLKCIEFMITRRVCMFIKLTAICRDKRGKRCSELEIFLRYDEIKEFYGKEDDVGSYTQIRCGDGTYMDVAEGLEYINSFLNAQTE